MRLPPQGKPPTLENLRWDGGEYGKRVYPYQPRGNHQARPTGEAEDEFQDAIKKSVEREKQDVGTQRGKAKK